MDIIDQSKQEGEMSMSNNPSDLVSIGEVTIPFYDDILIVQLGEDGEIYVALRLIVKGLGLSWGS